MQLNRQVQATQRPLPYLLTTGLLGLVAGIGCARSTAPTLSYSEGNVAEIRKFVAGKAKASESAAAAPAAEPTGWGNLKGKFRLAGAKPSFPPLNADKDTDVCAPGGNRPPDESVVVGPDNGLKNVLIFLSSKVPADNPKWEHESYGGSKSAEVLFDQKNCIFLSHTIAVRASQQVKILNSDPVGHNAKLDPDGPPPLNQLIGANGSILYSPGKPSRAPFTIACSIHPWMKAWMMVCESPYFAVTKDDGSFEIPNLPAGVPLEFRVWQERGNYLEAVTVDGAATQWKKGKFSLTLNDGESKQLDVLVDASVLK